MGNETKEKTWQRTKLPGLLRHKGGRYYGRFTIAGKTKFVPLETNLMEIARVRFAEHRSRIERTRKAARAAGQGVGRMRDLLTLYRQRVEERADIADNTRDAYREHIAYIEKTWPGFGDLRPDEITRTAVEKWRDRALKEGTGNRPPGSKAETNAVSGKSPGRFNKAVDALRKMLDIAIETGALHANPLKVRGIKAKDAPRKPKLPETDKLREVFEAMERPGGRSIEAALLCRFLAFTGCRLKEAAGVRWQDMDFERGIIHVNGTKTDAARREVPMIPAARTLLEVIRKRREKAATVVTDGKPHIDPASPVLAVREAQKSLTRACAAVGVDRLTHHDLRDAFATTCIEAGVDIPTVAAWLGHADGGALLMRIYAHHRRAHSVEQAAKVKFWK